MEDIIRHMSENEVINFSSLSGIDSKASMLTAASTYTELTQGYIVGFIHPMLKQVIFLANCADIAAICYAKAPKLPGTQNVKLAKFYSTIDAARSDIYLLRYHHREFLKIVIVAKPVAHFHAELLLPDSTENTIAEYPLSELMQEIPLHLETSEN